MDLKARAIAVSATFTAEPLQPGLAFWAEVLGLDCEVRFAGYNQLFQELLDPSGLFAHNCRGFNVVLVRFEDWRAAGVEASAGRLIEAIRSGAGAFSAPLMVVECPSATPAEAPARLVREAVAGIPSVHWISAEEVAALYPVPEVHDPHADELGHVPYTPVFFAALATAIARKIHAIGAPPFKVIAVDCDDTLWSGICGEDGPQGVALDAPRRELQEFLAGAAPRGHAAGPGQQEQRRRRGRDLPRASGDAAAPGGFHRPPHQLGQEERQPGIAGRGAGAGSRQLHPGGRQPQGMPRGAGRRAGSSGFAAACRPRRNPRLSAPRVGLRPRPGHRRGPAARGLLRPAAGTRARRPAPPAAWKSFWPRSIWKSSSRPCGRTKWRVSRSSPSAPTR